MKAESKIKHSNMIIFHGKHEEKHGATLKKILDSISKTWMNYLPGVYVINTDDHWSAESIRDKILAHVPFQDGQDVLIVSSLGPEGAWQVNKTRESKFLKSAFL